MEAVARTRIDAGGGRGHMAQDVHDAEVCLGVFGGFGAAFGIFWGVAVTGAGVELVAGWGCGGEGAAGYWYVVGTGLSG